MNTEIRKNETKGYDLYIKGNLAIIGETLDHVQMLQKTLEAKGEENDR